MKFTRTKAVLASTKSELSRTIDRCTTIITITIAEATDLFGLSILLFLGSLLVIEIVVTSITTVIGAVFKVTTALVKDLFKE